MAELKEFKTIPEMFYYLTSVYGRDKSRPVIRYKKDGQYLGMSYSELYKKTESFALGLASLGIKRGDRVAIIAESRMEWVVSDMAILALGAVNVPLYPNLTADGVSFILNNSEAAAAIVSNNFQLNKLMKVRSSLKYLKNIILMNNLGFSGLDNVSGFEEIERRGEIFKGSNRYYFEESLRLAREEDLCSIIYTSGTTGEPKGVMLSNKNICSNVKSATMVFPVTEADTLLSFLPLCHIYERTTGYYTVFSSGGTIAFAESIERVQLNMTEVKPTVMTAVPRLFEKIYGRIQREVESWSPTKQKLFNKALSTARTYMETLHSGESMPIGLSLKYRFYDKLVLEKIREKTGGRLRFIVSGSAPLARELGEFFEAVGIPIIEGYGMTEASPVMACNRLDNYKFGTVGKAFPGVELKIAKDGEILVSGPNIMMGYYRNKKETQESIKGGWLYTGDIGVFDAEGFLIITDRKKSLFKTSGGKFIAPNPIENLFLASRYIDQFVLIGDRRMFLSALIVPDFEALREYADAHRISYADNDELVSLKQINELMETDLARLQKDLAHFERVRKFTLLDKPFSIEDGELTPSLKVRRKVVEQRYSNLIDGMYKGLKA